MVSMAHFSFFIDVRNYAKIFPGCDVEDGGWVQRSWGSRMGQEGRTGNGPGTSEEGGRRRFGCCSAPLLTLNFLNRHA